MSFLNFTPSFLPLSISPCLLLLTPPVVSFSNMYYICSTNSSSYIYLYLSLYKLNCLPPTKIWCAPPLSLPYYILSIVPLSPFLRVFFLSFTTFLMICIKPLPPPPIYIYIYIEGKNRRSNRVKNTTMVYFPLLLYTIYYQLYFPI